MIQKVQILEESHRGLCKLGLKNGEVNGFLGRLITRNFKVYAWQID